MHEFVSFNCNIVSAQDASVSALSFPALYGKGVFTTVAICDGKPFLWKKHWRRLEANADKLQINLTEFSESRTKDALSKIVQKNNVTGGRARITFFDESPSAIWRFKTTRKASLLITTGDLRPVPDNFHLTISPYTVNSLSPLAGVKSCNYLENLMALDEAKSRGFDEAIQMNERGEVTSASIANVFWVKDGALQTPSLKTGCLPGTTREFVLENLECREVEASIDEINEADTIFLTSAGLGVVAVNEFDGRKLTVGDFPITNLLS